MAFPYRQEPGTSLQAKSDKLAIQGYKAAIREKETVENIC